MADTPEHLAGRLRAEGEKTLQFFQALTPDQWGQAVYAEGACWTVCQVLAHFVATEAAISRLLENILSGGPGAPEDFDLNAYNERKVAALESAGPGELLDQYAALRRQSVERVQGLTPADLLKTGRHPFLGMTPVEEIVKLVYRHNGIHLREMRRVLA